MMLRTLLLATAALLAGCAGMHGQTSGYSEPNQSVMEDDITPLLNPNSPEPYYGE